MSKRVQDLEETIGAINGLLNWAFLSPMTRIQLQVFKANLEAELRFILAQQADAQAAT